MRKSTMLALLGILACGDGNGPSSTTVEGNWNMSLSNMNTTGISCSTNIPIQLTLSQTGTTFGGTQQGGQITCSTPSGPSLTI